MSPCCLHYYCNKHEQKQIEMQIYENFNMQKNFLVKKIEKNCSTSICNGRSIKKLIELHQQCFQAALFICLCYFFAYGLFPAHKNHRKMANNFKMILKNLGPLFLLVFLQIYIHFYPLGFFLL